MLPLGDFKITRIEEMALAEPTALFAEWTPEIGKQNPWFDQRYYDEEAQTFVISVHSWLVKTPNQTILIDTSGGNGKERPASPRFANLNTPFLERLQAAGATPEDVDLVLLTHLHVDHVGWNTRLVDGRWVPTFPNATYVMPWVEVEWRDPKRGAADKPPATHFTFNDSIQPILDSGKAKLVEGNETVADGVDLMPIPGHAPGQMAVRLRSRGEEALFIADAMHQPIQVHYPEWNSKFCEDQELARKTRATLLAYCADHNSLICPGHFGAPYCGYVRRSGSGYVFVPSEQTP